jgi:hypothetical protein
MKRILACGVLICGLPMLGNTQPCQITMGNPPTFWQWIKALWTVNKCPS